MQNVDSQVKLSPLWRSAALWLFLLLCLGVFLVGGPSISAATTRVVDDDGNGDFTTVAAALAAASGGDLILVTGGADQVHSESDIVINKNVTLRGNGRSTTILQAAPSANSASSPVVSVAAGRTVVIEDLTLRNGRSTNGGGVYNPDGSVLTLRRVAVLQNESAGAGGGIYSAGDLTVEASRISGNAAEEAVVVTGCAGDYEVTLVYSSSTPNQYKNVFEAAAERWCQIITGDLSDVLVSGTHCSNSVAYSGLVDDVVIYADVEYIDGPGNVLGSAGPCKIRNGNALPYFGRMRFDSADLEWLADSGRLEATILHEMGHVLGVGTLWNILGLMSGSCAGGNGSSTFNGSSGQFEYQQLGGSGGIPVEENGGSGTACGHWDEETFDTEFMTGWLDQSANPISRMTIGAMEDMGYDVSYAAADPYSIPNCSPNCSRSAGEEVHLPDLGFDWEIEQDAAPPDAQALAAAAAAESAAYGGGIYASGTLELTNSLVSGNASAADGGGLYTTAGATLTNSTLVGNHAAGTGGGWVNAGGTAQIINTLVWDNLDSGGAGTANAALVTRGGGITTVSYSLIEGQNPAGSGNLDGTSSGNTPDFVTPLAGSAAPSSAGNFFLLVGSPGIDDGSNAACPAADYDQSDRPFDGNNDSTATCDIGAYEYAAPVVQFGQATMSTSEGDSAVALPLVRLGDTAPALSVTLSVGGGDAIAGQDFADDFPLVVNISAEETSLEVPLEILEDVLQESDETLVVQIGSGSDFNLGTPASVVVTIVDNDQNLVYLPLIIGE